MLITYYLIRLLTFPFAYMPYRMLRFIGKGVGLLSFYILVEFRKKTLSNLALAKELNLSNKEIVSFAKKSFQNLAINLLEYSRFDTEKHLEKHLKCENPQKAHELYQNKQGIIFFCGHQSNWEVLFLEGTLLMNGIAIGRPIKNKRLYDWIISIREKNNGKMISPKNALKEGLKNLRKGIFLGIVGDQAMPDSNYSFPFLGRRAYFSTAPALLAYKTNSPIIVATTKRTSIGYKIHYSDPIWPNLENPIENESLRLMDKSITLLQDKIKERPYEWLWQHNIYKQQSLKNLYKRFRQDAICIILPEEKEKFEATLKYLPLLKKIYPKEFLFIILPQKFKHYPLIESDETYLYQERKEIFLKDYRFKLIFNFSSENVTNHFKKFSALDVLTIKDLQKLASHHLKNEELNNISKVITKALCRPQSSFNN